MRRLGTQVVIRLALIAVLVMTGFVALSGSTGPALAQDPAGAGVGTAAAAISPEDAPIYFGLSLDTESPQWVRMQELLASAGFEGDLTDVADEIGAGAGGNADVDAADDEAFLGGEVAVVLAEAGTFAAGLEAISSLAGGMMMPGGDFEAFPEQDQGASATGSTGVESSTAGFVILLQPTDMDSARQQIESDLSGENGAAPTETEYNGVTIVTTAGDPSMGSSSTAYAFVDDFILVTGLPSDLEPFIDVAAGDAPSLAENENFQRANEALSGDRLAFGYFDGLALANAATGQPRGPLGIGNNTSRVPGTSFSAGLSIVADSVGLRFDTVQISADGNRVDDRQADIGLAFAGQVPAETIAFANGSNLGSTPVMQALGYAIASSIADQALGTDSEATPVVLPEADALFEDAATALGFNLQTEFLEQLIGEYGFALWFADPADPNSVAGVLTTGAESPDTVASALNSLALAMQAGSQGQASISTREIGEASVNVLTIEQDTGEPLVLEFGVVNGILLIGLNDGIDAYLAGASEALADSDRFRDAVAALPDTFTHLLYLDVAAIAGLAATSGVGDAGLRDDDSACAEYATQRDAQEALDGDPAANFFLDWDGDGVACGDYFLTGEIAGSPEPATEDFPIPAIASAVYVEDGLDRTTTIILFAAA